MATRVTPPADPTQPRFGRWHATGSHRSSETSPLAVAGWGPGAVGVAAGVEDVDVGRWGEQARRVQPGGAGGEGGVHDGAIAGGLTPAFAGGQLHHRDVRAG